MGGPKVASVHGGRFERMPDPSRPTAFPRDDRRGLIAWQFPDRLTMLFGGGPAAGAGALANHLRLQEGLAMKRLLVLFAVLVPLSLLIVGCGQGGGSSKELTDPKEKAAKMSSFTKATETKGKPAGLPGAPGQGGKK